MNDTLTIWDATNTTQVPLGSMNLQGDYVVDGKVVTFSPGALTMAGNSFTVTLGTPAIPADLNRAASGNRKVQWTPSAGAEDLAGNAAATNTYTEADNDGDF